MSEANLMRRIMLRLSTMPGIVTFRNNVGLGWSGRIVKHDQTRGVVTLADGADCIGWQTVTITPDMVGRTVALFVSIEVKTEGGRSTEPQRHFMRTVNEAGGVAGIVHSPDEAAALFESLRL